MRFYHLFSASNTQQLIHETITMASTFRIGMYLPAYVSYRAKKKVTIGFQHGIFASPGVIWHGRFEHVSVTKTARPATLNTTWLPVHLLECVSPLVSYDWHDDMMCIGHGVHFLLFSFHRGISLGSVR